MKGINYSDYIDVNSNTINITYPIKLLTFN